MVYAEGDQNRRLLVPNHIVSCENEHVGAHGTGLALPKVETQRSQKSKVAKVKLQKVVKAKGRKMFGPPKLS